MKEGLGIKIITTSTFIKYCGNQKYLPLTVPEKSDECYIFKKELNARKKEMSHELVRGISG